MFGWYSSEVDSFLSDGTRHSQAKQLFLSALTTLLPNEEHGIGLRLNAQSFRRCLYDLIKVNYTKFQRELNIPLKSHEARGRRKIVEARQKDWNQGSNHCSWPMLRAMPLLSLFPLLQHKSLNDNQIGCLRDFSGGTRSKEPFCQCRRHTRCGFDPWVRKIPWRRAWQPTPVFLPGESHGQRTRWATAQGSQRVGHD